MKHMQEIREIDIDMRWGPNPILSRASYPITRVIFASLLQPVDVYSGDFLMMMLAP